MGLEKRLKKDKIRFMSKKEAETIWKDMKLFEASVEYFDSDYEDLRHLYKDQYVAVYNGKVAGHDKDFDKLLTRLRIMNGIKLGSTYIQRTYFREEPPTLILYQNAG